MDKVEYGIATVDTIGREVLKPNGEVFDIDKYADHRLPSGQTIDELHGIVDASVIMTLVVKEAFLEGWELYGELGHSAISGSYGIGVLLLQPMIRRKAEKHPTDQKRDKGLYGANLDLGFEEVNSYNVDVALMKEAR